MRANVILSATIILIASALLLQLSTVDSSYPIGTAIFGIALGCLNLGLGLTTRKAGGVQTPELESNPVRLTVDKGVIGSTIYHMAFSREKLVLRRLSSGRVTLLTAIFLLVFGYTFAGLIGAAEAGITAFSIQEFLTQRKRNSVESENTLKASDRGDLEFALSDLEKMELSRTRLLLYFKDRLLRIVISRKYPTKMEPVLKSLMGSFLKETES